MNIKESLHIYLHKIQVKPVDEQKFEDSSCLFYLYSTRADGRTDHKYIHSTTRFNLHIHNVNNLVTTITEAADHSG
jgi:hypothetical protein